MSKIDYISPVIQIPQKPHLAAPGRIPKPDSKIHEPWAIKHSLRTADAFPVVVSLPPREVTTGNASAVRRAISDKAFGFASSCQPSH